MEQGGGVGVGLSNKLEIGEQLPLFMDHTLRIVPHVAPIGGPVDGNDSNLRAETQLGLPPIVGLNPRMETHQGFSPAMGLHPRTETQLRALSLVGSNLRTETQPRVLPVVGSNPRTETQSRVSPTVGSDAGMETQAGLLPVVGSNPRMETQPGLLPVVGLNAGMETQPGVLSTMGLNPRMEIQSGVLSVVGSNPRTETQSGVLSVVGSNPRTGTQFGMSSTVCLNPRMETQVLSTVGLNPRTETQPGVSSTVGSNPQMEVQPGGLSVVGSNPRMETQPGMSSMLGSNPRTETQPVMSSMVSSNSRSETQSGVLSMAGSNQPTLQASTMRRLPSFGRNSDRNIYGTRQRMSPLNSGLWISIEAIITIGQIVSAIAVVSVSRNEKPETPLSTYIIGYALGCIATLPLLYWRYSHHYVQRLNQDSSLAPPPASPSSPPRTPRLSYSTPVGTLSRDEEAGSGLSSIRMNRRSRNRSLRIGILMERFKIALDCFFAVWFVVGNVWIFGGHSSANEAPNLYRLCIVFLTFSCIGYAMPFILCATVCCCLPCIITLLGFREDHGQTKGAAPEAIAVLPTYKFKAIYSTEAKRVMDGNDSDSEGSGAGGYIAIGTNKERAVSADDAVCCICLGKYNDGAELRELPCAHFFHTKCVDEWLKINASCPLCKHEIVSRDQED